MTVKKRIRDLRDPALEPLIQRHQQYWLNGESQRPLFQICRTQSLEGTLESHLLEPPEPLDIAQFRANTEKAYDETGLLADDLFRLVSTSIPSEALVGCPMVARAGTQWAENCFSSWHQLDNYQLRDTLWYRRLMENTQRAVEAADPEQYPFACMSFRGAVDMAEAMMGGERLCTEVVDHPRQLKDLLGRITDIIIQTAVAHSSLLPMYQGGQFNSYGIWTPGRTVTFTLDGGCLFSPACYEEFFLPCDQRLCQALDTPFVHLHAASCQHFEAWTAIDNLGLQCVIDQAWLPEGRNKPIGPQLPQLLDTFKRIRASKSLMLYGVWDATLIDMALAQLPPGGCAITGMVEDPATIRRQYITADK